MMLFALVRRLKRATRESSCRLRRGEDCHGGAHRLVGRIADAVELGLGVHHRETNDRLVPHGTRLCPRAPRQELALRIRGALISASTGCWCRSLRLNDLEWPHSA